MNNGAYLAICYICNEKCSFCPCTNEEKKGEKIVDIDSAHIILNQLQEKNCKSITISGGEPTLHPNFVEIVSYAQNSGMYVTVLSNGEMLADKHFVLKIKNNVDMSRLRIITTLHSSKPDMHEKVNGIEGSFQRSIEGIMNIHNIGGKIEIKHCITKENVKELKEFYLYCDNHFPEDISIQLCAIDYVGIDKKKLETEFLSFRDVRPYLESAFNAYLEDRHRGNKRRLYAINIPLCACDIYYWKLLTLKKEIVYESYADPHTKEIENNVEKNVSVNLKFCRECKAIEICSGTYKTAFDYFGERLVMPYIE